MSDVSSSVVTITLWLLMVFSLISWTVMLAKIGWSLKLARQNREFRARFWAAHGLAEAEAVLQQTDGTLARICRSGFGVLKASPADAAALRCSGERRTRLERALRDELHAQRTRLESGLMLLASIGATAPFVGLFGTVWGIMHALEGISLSGSAGLDVVAGPIGEALVATALGIATAVPAVLAYNYGLRRAKVHSAELENFAADFIGLAEGV